MPKNSQWQALGIWELSSQIFREKNTAIIWKIQYTINTLYTSALWAQWKHNPELSPKVQRSIAQNDIEDVRTCGSNKFFKPSCNVFWRQRYLVAPFWFPRANSTSFAGKTDFGTNTCTFLHGAVGTVLAAWQRCAHIPLASHMQCCTAALGRNCPSIWKIWGPRAALNTGHKSSWETSSALRAGEAWVCSPNFT